MLPAGDAADALVRTPLPPPHDVDDTTRLPRIVAASHDSVLVRFVADGSRVAGGDGWGRRPMTDVPGRGTGDEAAEILLVADDRDDVEHVSAALDGIETETRLRTYSRCEEAIDALSGGAARRPHLALVDPHLPDDDGRAFLRTLRADPALRDLPVIVLSTSASTEDVRRYYDAGANAVVRKPTDPSAFDPLIEAVIRFWIERAELPPTSN